jgi:tRNA pseudouridine38-40 synthase
MNNVALKLTYDGSSFLGWQKTVMGPSIEGALESCLAQILQETISLQAASRTDRGVHAEAQWVNFICKKKIDLQKLKRSLNALLPTSIRVLAAQAVPDCFHPTLHVLHKEYHYHVTQGTCQLPRDRFFFWHVPCLLHMEAMEKACQYLIGEKDFTSFCNFRKNLCYPDKIRKIERVEIYKNSEKKLLFVLEGKHFLYKMVRNIVGTLIYVGMGKLFPEMIPEIINSKSRNRAGMTAPAHGLTLKKIYYPQEFNLEL